MAKRERTPEERAAFGRKMAEARAAKQAEREGLVPIAGGATAVAEPDTEEVSAVDVDTVIITDVPIEFDPKATYVVMTSGFPLPLGLRHQHTLPAFYGDLIAAQPGKGVFGLACPELSSPQDAGIICQEASDGVERLQIAFERGQIKPVTDPEAREARRSRLHADGMISGGRASGARVGDPRFAMQKGNA